jgi:hypothetical protein
LKPERASIPRSLTTGLFSIFFVRAAKLWENQHVCRLSNLGTYFRVLRVSWRNLTPGARLTIKRPTDAPPKASWRMRVNLEFLYGIRDWTQMSMTVSGVASMDRLRLLDLRHGLPGPRRSGTYLWPRIQPSVRHHCPSTTVGHQCQVSHLRLFPHLVVLRSSQINQDELPSQSWQDQVNPRYTRLSKEVTNSSVSLRR